MKEKHVTFDVFVTHPAAAASHRRAANLQHLLVLNYY